MSDRADRRTTWPELELEIERITAACVADFAAQLEADPDITDRGRIEILRRLTPTIRAQARATLTQAWRAMEFERDDETVH